MCITEYNEAETMQAFRNEGWMDGRKEGQKEGQHKAKKEMALRMPETGELSVNLSSFKTYNYN